MKFLSIFCLCFTAVSVFANAGIFGGFGRDIVLEKSEEIQMVSEEVIMRPGRSRTFVDGGIEGMDQMEYFCSFQLRNLSDKEVTVQVGFPLSSGDNISVPRKPEMEFTAISNHKFAAGTEKEGSYPLRYIPGDKENKFRHIFLWRMTFAPKEEKILKVSYTMNGYNGLGSTRQRPIDWSLSYKSDYLKNLELATAEMFGYVTATGNSWAGKIEKAVFKIVDLDLFEEYLDKRGALEKSSKSHEGNEFTTMLRYGQRLRSLTPEGWQLSTEKRKQFLTLEYAPFKPGMEIMLMYQFTTMPRSIEGLDYLLANLGKFDGNSIKIQPGAEKNLADVILEFYGIARNNPDIADFLKLQTWYPVKNPPALDDALKTKLLALSGK